MHLPFTDLRYSVRQLRKSRGFAITAILTLALGIGATTAIFSIVEGVLLRPLPFHDPGKLVSLKENLHGYGVLDETAPDVRAYARDSHAFKNLGGYQQEQLELSGSGQPSELNVSRMTAGIFPTLRVPPLLGRVFTLAEDNNSQQVAILSYSLWKSRFHGNQRVLGTKLLLDRKPYIVIGVMPRSFEFPLQPGHLNQTQLWVPMSFTNDELTRGAGSFNVSVVARLKPGVSLAQAASDTSRVAREIMRGYTGFMQGLHITPILNPLKQEIIANAQPLLRVLFLAVFVVLLIACANLAGLLLVRAIRRRREIAVRLAIGASSASLLRQALLESLLLSGSGGVLGILLAAAALPISIRLLPETLPRLDGVGLDWSVVLFALFLALATGILCGIAPAFAALRTDMNEALKQGGRTGSSGSSHGRFRSALVVAEIAVSLILLTAASLLITSFEKMRAVDPGFRPGHVVIASYALPQQQ